MRNIPRAAIATLCGSFVSTIASAGDVTYAVTDLPSFGGTRNQGNSINDASLIAGFSTRPGDLNRHATLWADQAPQDLGTLGGPNSSVVWPVKNVSGLIAGISQTSTPETLGESWSCSAFFTLNPTGYLCRGFAWASGQMRTLPTLGGPNGFAA